MTTLQSMRYGWGDGSRDYTEPFWLSFSRCQQEPDTWDREIRRAAVHIAETARKPIWVCFSGGVDSEVVGELFLELGIPFSALTLAFKDGKNEHDIQYAREWCAEHKINQKIVPFDLEQFAASIPELIAQDYVADHYFRFYQLHLLELVEDLGGFAVLGGGEQLYELVDSMPSPDKVVLNMDVGFTTCLEWCRRHQAVHEPYFYFSRPEILLSWLRTPLVDFCLKHPDVLVHPQNKYLLKIMAMRTFFPRQRWRPKFNGFERVEYIRHRVRNTLKESLGAKSQVYRLHVSALQEQLRPAPIQPGELAPR